MKTDMELLSNSMATYAHIKGNYGNHSACYTVKKNTQHVSRLCVNVGKKKIPCGKVSCFSTNHCFYGNYHLT